jgi:DNA-binding winged helix-turn-helix (wHTH) protein
VQCNQHVLLISSKNYIIGLIEGYCSANQLPLETFPEDNSSHPPNIINKSQLIIIDASQPGSSLDRSKYKTISQTSHDYHIPVCSIVNGSFQKEKTTSWIDCFFADPILEQLDNYFRIHFHYKSHPFPDRRHQDRRILMDRRYNNNTQALSLKNQLPPPPKSNIKIINLDPFDIDTGCQTVSLNGVDLELTCKEFKLFSLLSTDINRVFSADEIIHHLWPEGYRANKSDLYQYMHLLRKKVEEDPDNPQWIKTVKRVGYRLNITSGNLNK